MYLARRTSNSVVSSPAQTGLTSPVVSEEVKTNTTDRPVVCQLQGYNY